ncbi:MAG: hypothetical protein H6752_06765 [Candidatus Omnitrophica bacterium]|nr:hypothetical protein [Candidatus Omnitrophota bacterium]
MNRELEGREESESSVRLLVLVFLAISFGYLLWAESRHLQGDRGVLRGAVLFFLAGVFGFGSAVMTGRIAPVVRFCALFVLAVGAFDLIVHSPGCSIFGLEPRFKNDFEINLTAAQQMYGEGGSPYGIQEEFNLPNASISFPFPTYWVYWACSGFGGFDPATTGAIFTALNLFAAIVLIRASRGLSGIGGDESELIWFLTLISPIWGTVLIGQTPVMAAALISAGWLTLRSEDFMHLTFGALLVAFGILIKPNFAPLVVGPLLIGLLDRRHQKQFNLSLGIIAALVGVALCAILIPGGVGLDTLGEFRDVAVPKALTKVEAHNNLSLVGFLHFLLPMPIHPKATGLFLVTILTALGVVRRLDWKYWFLVPLIVSPITWGPYLSLALPVQFALAKQSDAFIQTLVILSAGLIGLDYTGFSTLGVLILLWLVIQSPQAEGPGKRW